MLNYEQKVINGVPTKGHNIFVIALNDLNQELYRDLYNSLGSGFTSGSTLTTVSLKECDTSLFNVQVYPNPTEELVFIKIEYSFIEDFFLTITNLEGKVIKYTKYNKQEKLIAINTSDFTPGTYLLNFEDKNHVLLSSYKIIKQ